MNQHTVDMDEAEAEADEISSGYFIISYRMEIDRVSPDK